MTQKRTNTVGAGAFEGPPTPRFRPAAGTIGWYTLLATVLLIEAALLHFAASRDIAPYVPRSHDQIQYLTESYRSYDQIRERGWIDGLSWSLHLPRAQGWLLQTQATVLFGLIGPSRLAALDLNLVYYLLFFGVTAEAARRTLSLPAALVAMGLLASALTLTRIGGGLFDFRLDFVAMCLWGSLLSLTALAYPGSRRFVPLAVMVLGTMLILSRLIAAVYLLPFLGALWLGTVVVHVSKRRRTLELNPLWLLATLAIWVAALAALVYFNLESISGYYIRGHVTGEEKDVRAAAAGLLTLFDSLGYYPRSLERDHLGPQFLQLVWFSLIAVLVPAIPGFIRGPGSWSPRLAWTCGVLGLGFLIPYVVLTVNQQKNDVVGNVFVPTIALVTAAIFYVLGQRAIAWGGAAARWWVAAVAGLVLIAGLFWQFQRISQRQYDPTPRNDLAAYTALVDDVGAYFGQDHRAPVLWAIDEHFDFLSAGTVQVFAFERHRKWFDFRPGLGHGPIEWSLSPKQVLDEAASSDVLALTRRDGGPPLYYPYDVSVAAAKPALFELAERDFVLLHRSPMFGYDVHLYVKRQNATGGSQTIR